MKRKGAPSHGSRTCPQLSIDSFRSMDEITSWIQEKVGNGSLEHPHCYHENWQLCEYYFEFDKGLNHEIKHTKLDKLEKSASDCGGAVAALGDGEAPNKRRGLSYEEKHKLWMTKTNTLVQKLSRSITTCESKLPPLRRTTSGEVYAKLKLGVQKCREIKDNALEELEDNKSIDQFDEGIVQKVMDLNAKVLEHHAALLEAFKALEQQTPSTPTQALKLEGPPPPESPAVSSGGSNC